MRAAYVIGAVLVLIVTFRPGEAVPANEPARDRNPFGVPDVPDPDGQDVQNYAANVQLAGDDKDANAEQWVKDVKPGDKGSLDGEWSERWNADGGDWNYGTEASKIKVVGDRVYILANCSTGKYLIDLKREKNRLIGKYRGVDDPCDTGPVVFEVVSDERIDGSWGGTGRWDFRRKLR